MRGNAHDVDNIFFLYLAGVLVGCRMKRLTFMVMSLIGADLNADPIKNAPIQILRAMYTVMVMLAANNGSYSGRFGPPIAYLLCTVYTER